MKYVLGTIIIAIGFVIVWKADWMMNNFGRISWAEEHLGTEGGTRMLYKIIGILAMIFSFLYMSGAIQAMLRVIFKPTIDAID